MSVLEQSDLFGREEKRAEKLVNYIRILITLLYFAAGFGAKSDIPASSLYIIYAVCALNFVYSLGIFFLSRKNPRPFLKYVSSTVDIVLLTAVLYALGTFRTFKTEAFLIYFLWIALAAVRVSVRLTVFTGILSVVSYLLLIVAAVFRETIQPGSMTDHFTSAKVSLASQGLRIAFLTACFSAAAYAVRNYRATIAQSGETAAPDVHPGPAANAPSQGSEKEYLLRFLSPQTTERIISQRMALLSGRHAATILFCDIRDFTGLSETMPPEEITSLLGEYRRRMLEVIFEHGGMIERFVGDEIMAVFGLPVSTGRDEEMAVRTAVTMKKVLAEMNELRAAAGKAEIAFGIGIHTGSVVAENIGTSHRSDYTVVGQTVTLANRIETLNKFLGTDILVTEETYARVQHIVEVEKQRLVRVKGIEQPIQTYRILAARPS